MSPDAPRTPHHRVSVLAPVGSAYRARSSDTEDKSGADARTKAHTEGVVRQEEDVDVAADTHSVSTEERLHVPFLEHHRCRPHEEKNTRAPGQVHPAQSSAHITPSNQALHWLQGHAPPWEKKYLE